jgi:hypothetical protein
MAFGQAPEAKQPSPHAEGGGAAFVHCKNANAPHACGKILDKKPREPENVETIRYFGSRFRVLTPAGAAGLS